MEDLLRYLLVSSDPVLSSFGLEKRRRENVKRQGGLLPEVMALLACPVQPEGAAVSASSRSSSPDAGHISSGSDSDE